MLEINQQISSKVFHFFTPLVIFALLILNANAAQIAESSDSTKVLVPRVSTPPSMDGVIGEGEWDLAVALNLEYQIQPGDNTKATESTRVRISYDGQNLYLAFDAQDQDSSSIRARVTRRDEVFNDDYVSIYLDTFNDRRKAYSFYFNPLGIQADGVFTEQSNVNRFDTSGRDLTWDGILTSKGSVRENGFVIEVAIPFKTLRFDPDQDVWGIHLERWISRKAERISWKPISRTSSGYLIQMGSVGGLVEIAGAKSIDLIPTLVGSANEDREQNFNFKKNYDAEPGLTGNWTVTTNTALGGTINPDFSQVESDAPQIEVNQRFPLFFPEKRPFFLEGTEIFRGVTASGNAYRLVDTRQIVDPDFGLKFTGKIGSNSIGVLSASDNSQGLVLDPASEEYGRNAWFNILRYQRDILKDSAVGLFVNDYRFADTSNTLIAADGRIRLSESNDVGFQAIYTWSQEFGGTRLIGGASHFRFSHAGKPWRLTYYFSTISPNYINLSGFTRRTGITVHSANLGYEFLPSSPTWFVSIRPFIVPRYEVTSEGFVDESYVDPGVDITFAKGISVYAYRSFDWVHFADRDFRYQFSQLYCTIDTFRKFFFDTSFYFGEDVNYDLENAQVGNARRYDITVAYKPNARLNTEFRFLSSKLNQKGTDAELFDQRIYRNRTLFYLNQNHWFRGIVEYDTFEGDVSLSLLYAYTPSPGTAVYVGYGDEYVEEVNPITGRPENRFVRSQRTLFAKISYNFRF